MLEVFQHIRIKAAARNNDASTPPTWIDPKAATFYDNLTKACAEHLATIRESTDDDEVELSQDTVDTIFESLVVPNAKKRFYPVGNLELPSSSQRSQSQHSQRRRGEDLQKTIEEMRQELENERTERLRIEEERHIERIERQRLEEEQAKLAQQQQEDRENFQAQLTRMMAMVQRNNHEDI